MTKKKELESKFIYGDSIVWFQGRDDHISCRTDEGERIAISGDMFFRMLNRFTFTIKQWGDYWKVTGLATNPPDE